MTHLCVTVRWLDDRYHGLLSHNGPPEWPPSPYRLFQALVAGLARSGELDTPIGKSLAWLQALDAPVIIAPRHKNGQAITRFVPNNDGDKKPDRQDRLTAKPTMPTLMLDPPEMHYVWELGAGQENDARLVCQAARCLSCLGWGIDMAYADGRVIHDDAEIGNLAGVRWYPRPGAMRDDGQLRIPLVDRESAKCTLCDLKNAHESALNRIQHGQPLRTVDKPNVFERVVYASVERPLGRPYALFELRTDDDAPFRYAHAKLIHIAGMVRHAAIQAMTDNSPPGVDADWIRRVVRGKREPGVVDHAQFSYVPLPSIGHEQADGMIRRVMVVAPFEFDAHLRHLSEQLDGVRLNPEGEPETCKSDDAPAKDARPTLQRIRPDGVARCYLGAGEKWATVTPAILPGYDDHRPAKTVKLIEKAMAQCGVDQRCKFTWSTVPNYKNCLTAHKYDRQHRFVGYHRPEHLKIQTAVHLRLSFEKPFAGPLVIGCGRHCGLGTCSNYRQ
jgi:CRISPR-associated protein Csb2